MKHAFIFLAVIIIFVTPIKAVDVIRDAGPTVENGALMSNGFPPEMQVCATVPARSAPLDDAIIVKTIAIGEVVNIRDKGRGYAQYWVLISADPIMWIPMRALCKR